MTTVMGACEEDGNALFFYRYEEVEDESPVALHLPCLFLSEIKGYKEICENHIDSNDGRGPAREVCPVTLELAQGHVAFTLALCAFLQKMTTVMGACEEDGNALFFYRYEEVEDESPVALHLPCLFLSEIKGYKEICENHKTQMMDEVQQEKFVQ
eukprot:CAMPEP_0204642290 /NCGR_PEP_ID=MMETSP0717-20131115/51605_1 /ASSEMBLY_ACC=CAM_ASM_000666 /TAXON_ID=230516 /ORGANISM="Chaetoceros curvisetus" /LENGTH=154 /DNA_ID=CAMNT_0051663051 /DNA_START=96 /DNA_END=562 /DNA_ORIENTATION=-